MAAASTVSDQCDLWRGLAAFVFAAGSLGSGQARLVSTSRFGSDPSIRQNRMGGLRPRLSHAAYSVRSRLRKPPWRVCPVRDISGSRAVRMVLAGSQLRTPLTIVFAWPCVLAVCSGGAVRQLWAARRFGDASSNMPTRAAGRHRLWGSWTVSAGGSCEAVRLSSVPDNRR